MVQAFRFIDVCLPLAEDADPSDRDPAQSESDPSAWFERIVRALGDTQAPDAPPSCNGTEAPVPHADGPTEAGSADAPTR